MGEISPRAAPPNSPGAASGGSVPGVPAVPAGGGLLGRLAGAAVRRPRTTLAVLVSLVVLAGVLIASKLELRTSNLDLVDPNLPEVASFRDFAEAFGTPNVLVVALEGRSEATLRQAVDSLAPQLAGLPGVRAVDARVPGSDELLRRFGRDGYFHTRDRKMFFLFVQPADPSSQAATIAPFVAGVRAAVVAARLEEQGIGVGFTGLPQYAIDDRDVIQRDVSRLSLISAGLVLALWVFAYVSLLRPVLAMVALAGAALMAVGVAALWPGYLTLLSAFVASILFGMGDDFGVHLIDGIEARVAAGADEATAAVGAATALGPSLGTGSVAIALAFLALTAAGFRGFAELGAIAGVGVVICLLVMVTALPSMLVLLPARRAPSRSAEGGDSASGRGRVGERIAGFLARPWVAVVVVLLALGGPLIFGFPGFDGDYLSLQPRDSEAVRIERAMVDRSELSPQFAALVAPSRRAALELVMRLRATPEVGEVFSIADADQLAALVLADAQAEPPRAGDVGRDAAGLATMRRRFASADGRFAVYAHPRGDVWNPDRQLEFLAAVGRVAREVGGPTDPGAGPAADTAITVTGMPVLGRFMIDHSLAAMRRALGLALVGVLLVLALDFRRLATVLLALLPVALGSGLLVIGMQVFAVAWNPLDVMALPVVLGYGVGNGVHLVHRFLAEEGDLGRTLAGTGRSILLSSLTTLASFAPLCATSHRGLASFAAVLTLGVAATLVTSLLALPQALRWWWQWRQR